MREIAQFAVEHERGEFGAAVVVGNQAVEQAAARAGRTRVKVSIPKHAGMGLVAEGLKVEAAFATAQLAAQRREARPVDMSRAQDKTVRSFLELEPIAGFHDLEGARIKPRTDR